MWAFSCCVKFRPRIDAQPLIAISGLDEVLANYTSGVRQVRNDVRPNVQFIHVPGGVNAPADLGVFGAHLSVQF
jgi:hypothetical protein